MITKANLVAFLLLTSFCYIVKGSENVETNESSDDKIKERIEVRAVSRVPDAYKIVRGDNKIVGQGSNLIFNRFKKDKKEHLMKDRKQHVYTNTTVNGKTDYMLRGRPKRKKRRRRRNRALMALLLAYKMKFVALIPTLVGGFFLLIGKAILAGFFFALFAAVLSLKSH